MPFAAFAFLLLTAWFASPAHGADRVYWTNESAEEVSFANLDGSGGGDLAIAGTTVNQPQGVAIDAAAGRIYWINYGGPGGNRISFAGLDGAGGTDLNTTGATVSSPYGLAIDPAAGKVYWANAAAGVDDISFAHIDGSGGGNLNTTGATLLSNPQGVAIDPSAGRIYWANTGADTISFANLDGSGGGDVNTGEATLNNPIGVALDSAAGRVYWANSSADTISYANLDGSGGGDVSTAGATLSDPAGVAIDPGAGRIYWANSPTVISYASLDGIGGGGDLNLAGATINEGSFPVLLKAPGGTGAPAVTVAPTRGSRLSCSQGSWAPDLLGSFLYRAPQNFAYSWSRGGTVIAGAAESTFSPAAVGSYSCTVTASNAAGSNSQTSSAQAIQVAALRGLRISPSSFPARAGGPSAMASARKKPGARVTFRLNEGATVAFKVKRRRSARRGGSPRFVTLRGGFRRVGTRGKNSFRFSGRLRGRKLKPGRYLLSATPKGVGKAGRTRSIGFRIKPPRR